MNYNPKLSATTTRALAQQQAEREGREAAATKELADAQRENGRVRAAYLAGLEAKKAARRVAADAEVDTEIAPDRTRLERQWRADHPDMDARDFERKAWPMLRANLVEAREQAQREALRRQMQASGRYSL